MDGEWRVPPPDVGNNILCLYFDSLMVETLDSVFILMRIHWYWVSPLRCWCHMPWPRLGWWWSKQEMISTMGVLFCGEQVCTSLRCTCSPQNKLWRLQKSLPLTCYLAGSEPRNTPPGSLPLSPCENGCMGTNVILKPIVFKQQNKSENFASTPNHNICILHPNPMMKGKMKPPNTTH